MNLSSSPFLSQGTAGHRDVCHLLSQEDTVELVISFSIDLL